MVTIDSKPGELHITYDMLNENLETKFNGVDGLTIRIKSNVVSSDRLSTDNDDSQSIYTQNLPSVEQVIEFLRSKPHYRHDSAEIQMYFIGKILKSRGDDNQLYHSLAAIVRNARSKIESECDGEWVSPSKRRIQGQKPVTVFEFKEKIKP